MKSLAVFSGELLSTNEYENVGNNEWKIILWEGSLQFQYAGRGILRTDIEEISEYAYHNEDISREAVYHVSLFKNQNGRFTLSINDIIALEFHKEDGKKAKEIRDSIVEWKNIP